MSCCVSPLLRSSPFQLHILAMWDVVSKSSSSSSSSVKPISWTSDGSYDILYQIDLFSEHQHPLWTFNMNLREYGAPNRLPTWPTGSRGSHKCCCQGYFKPPPLTCLSDYVSLLLKPFSFLTSSFGCVGFVLRISILRPPLPLFLSKPQIWTSHDGYDIAS